jgi:hypothetical protein
LSGDLAKKGGHQTETQYLSLYTLNYLDDSISHRSKTEAANLESGDETIPTFELNGRVFKSILNGKVERNPMYAIQRVIAEAHAYRIPYGSFPMELDNLNFAKSHMERTVKVTLPPGKGYDRGTFCHHIDALMGIDKLEACGSMAVDHIWQLTFVDNDSRDRFIAAGNFETPQGVTARVNSLKK